MPELPEVEMARENLVRWLAGRRILSAHVLDRRMLRGQSARCVEDTLRGARVRELTRRGKHIIWDLGHRGRIASHFGMSGRVVRRDEAEPEPPGTRIVLRLTGGLKVAFVDRRRLGSFQIVDERVEAKLARLGVEPLGRAFTAKRLAALLYGARLPIKSFLMDQHRVAGLGNIYVAEALYRAGIHPKREAGRLCREEVDALHRAIRATLQETLRRDRSEEVPYLEEEDDENPFLVYGRSGEPCPGCRRSIRRIVQAGRSTYFCPGCQPLKKRGKT